ncbi:hypothetical protein Bbelb_185830 [Branchiostoma belcheri]|nr:hypothetical protein Bbelb_185830 [Branchiostoma belcheri]
MSGLLFIVPSASREAGKDHDRRLLEWKAENEDFFKAKEVLATLHEVSAEEEVAAEKAMLDHSGQSSSTLSVADLSYADIGVVGALEEDKTLEEDKRQKTLEERVQGFTEAAYNIADKALQDRATNILYSNDSKSHVRNLPLTTSNPHTATGNTPNHATSHTLHAITAITPKHSQPLRTHGKVSQYTQDKRDNRGHQKLPVMSIPWENVIIDTLHMYLRIGGKLLSRCFQPSGVFAEIHS